MMFSIDDVPVFAYFVRMIPVFICTGLLVYWVSRMWMLMREHDVEVIEETLENDRTIWQRIRFSLRSLFAPSWDDLA